MGAAISTADGRFEVSVAPVADETPEEQARRLASKSAVEPPRYNMSSGMIAAQPAGMAAQHVALGDGCVDCANPYKFLPPGFQMPVQMPVQQNVSFNPFDESTMMGTNGAAGSIYDAHISFLDFFQQSEGMNSLLKCMDDEGISRGALHGCPLKKSWTEFEGSPAPDPFNDTDTLYYFSLTDTYLAEQMRKFGQSRNRLVPLLCGFSPTDKSAPGQIEKLMESTMTSPGGPWMGLGKIYLRSSEITNLTNGPNAYPTHVAFDMIMTTAANRALPVVIEHNAGSESTKPWKTAQEYLPELSDMLKQHPAVPVLWVHAGCFVRGTWEGYSADLRKMIKKHPNLFLSITPEVLHGGTTQIDETELIQLVEQFPMRFMVGSTAEGKFQESMNYSRQWAVLKDFLAKLSPATKARVQYDNAQLFYAAHERGGQNRIAVGEAQPDFIRRVSSVQLAELHEDQDAARELDKEPPTAKHTSLKPEEIEHYCIDTHLHMLDFLMKSSGMPKILQAMDGCGVSKAVLIGMPCCKKWSKDEPERPLYYQDDNAQCYVYAYSDQMVADAWLALQPDQRLRFAPVMAAFNPTDIASIDHVRRMWDKYPRLFRGLGEVMCRHDDLTMLLQDNETPVINHQAMRPMYEFCIEKNINCLVHHNADRTAEKTHDGTYEYLWEVKQVLDMFPTLRLVWCHCGVSRRTFEETHHEMIDEMMTTYPNLNADISWVVWEDVICGPDGVPKPGWVELFEKHPTRFTMGSDQVGQFIGPAGHNWLKPEIVKYWTLSKVLTPATAKAILYDNAERIWFEGWDVPTLEKDGPRFAVMPPTMKAETLHMNEGKFVHDGFY